ncbi:MAG: hypothetical protein NVSMB57_03670 [Actinomycetota bacterium]
MPELFVAMVVLAIAVVATMQVFAGSLRTAAATGHRTDAVSLAVRDIEAMHAIPYEQLGFSSSQAGYSSTFVDGSKVYNTVRVAAPQMSPAQTSIVYSGVTYNLQRFIYWVDADSTHAEAYKQVSVVVSWTAGGVSRTVRQDSIIYPGSLGAYKGPQGGSATPAPASTGQPTAPSLTATQSVKAPSSQINLRWTPGATPPAVDHWVVQYSVDSFVTASTLPPSQPAAVTSFVATGLAAGTTYQFRVGAAGSPNGTPTWSNVVSQSTTAGSSVGACTITDETVTPTPVSRLSSTSQALASDVSVIVHSTGNCQSLSVRYTPMAGNNARVYLTADAPKTTWTGTMNGTATSWELGNHLITVWDEVATAAFAGPAGLTVNP